jgi:hypothetical protein
MAVFNTNHTLFDPFKEIRMEQNSSECQSLIIYQRDWPNFASETCEVGLVCYGHGS